MTTYLATGSAQAALTDADLEQALTSVLDSIGKRNRVLVVPPDFTRRHSRAGELTVMCHRYFGPALADVLPALGTHRPMTPDQLDDMYPGIPRDIVREHRWRTDVVTVGEVDAGFVEVATEGIWKQAWPCQMNRLIAEGGHDLVVSIGQVVPHEVMGMANYNKNIFIGTGGHRGINESHFIGAAYGMERMMGVADTPLRRILNEAERRFCGDLPLLYVLTVIGPDAAGGLVTRGLFIGDDPDCFEQAAALSRAVNFTRLDAPVDKAVVYLPPDEFHSTWLGNKAIYRTRLALADDAELVILAPGVGSFGEDEAIDRLIRRHGYRTTPEIMAMLKESKGLQDNLSAAAHLIHGSTEGRFRVTYCPGGLTREEVEGVGYGYGELAQAMQRYAPDQHSAGWCGSGDDAFYYIPNPALGLWASKDRMS